ncbi:MAG: FAD-dependent oxidoreductase [Candidatus Aminicenantales bacterium]
MDYDALVIGGGIAGMESALNLGDMGYSVLLVEKEASLGGKMVLLSKVFPTLDCASCISAPKTAATFHHPNISLLKYSEVREIKRTEDGRFKVGVLKKPTFVNEAKCTGCQECEFACTVALPDQFNEGLVARRAAYIPFPQAVPKKALIDRAGTSPCISNCPAGIKAHGYISLARSGKYEEAYQLILEDSPMAGSLGRACYAPCEQECSRSELEGPLAIRRIKRFIADVRFREHPEALGAAAAERKDKKVGIIGAGPAGLSAAYFLAKKGYGVRIFEKEREAGGMLTTAIPSFRLPKDIVKRDIKEITALGVEIQTGEKIQDLGQLKKQGFDALFVALGTTQSMKMGIEGEDLENIHPCMRYLKSVNLGEKMDFSGKTVLLVGGGNVCLDVARIAPRLGAKRVIIQYRRSRAEMPAFDWEIKAAEEEGVEFHYLCAPVRFIGKEGKVTEVESIRMKLGESDESGRRRPVPIKGSEFRTLVDHVIVSIGLSPETGPFKKDFELNKNGTIKVDPETLQTSRPHIFAGGDAVTGPSLIINAIAQGKRAAFYMDRYLSGKGLQGAPFESELPVVKKEDVIKRQKTHSYQEPIEVKGLPPAERIKDFRELEFPLSEEEARYCTSRCLDCSLCSQCHQCITACPADAVDFSMREEEEIITAASVILSTGFRLFDPEKKVEYGSGRFKNVITSMQMDRLLAPTRPYNTILRPLDGKIPGNIAYVLCAGSRDHTTDNPICSQVCCMYSIKQAQLLMGALPLADITLYYIDIRAFGKGFEEFYQQAKAMGTYFIKGKIAKIEEKDNGNLILRYEDIDNGGIVKEVEHDLVVLSVGLLPNPGAAGIFPGDRLLADDFQFIKQVDEDLSPGKTSLEGVFVAGTASGPMDIPDSVLHAGAAALQAAAHIERTRKRQ